MASSTAPQWRTLCKQRVPDSANSAMWLRPMQPLLKLQNRVFNYRRKTTDTIKQTEAENVTTSHFAARICPGVEAHA